MSSIIEGYNYDIFISYRQKDNKGDRWVSEFVEALRTELDSTFKEDISIYFDENPHDGLLETDDVVKLQKEIVDIIAESNHFILDSMKELSVVFESGQYLSDKRILKRFRTTISGRQRDFLQQINNSVNNLYRIHNYQIFEPLYKLLK